MFNIIKYIDEKKKELRIVTKEAIAIFDSVLKKNFDDYDLENWENNLSNLRVGFDTYKYKRAARYEITTNTIYLRKIEYAKYLYHELFHVASSFVSDDVLDSGFMRLENNHIIGYGLNEGYTELLTERYIDSNLGKDSIYYLEKYYALMLEELIGQKQMESLYLDGNLIGLISILFKYAKEDEVTTFLQGLDDINDRNFNNDLVADLNRILLSWNIRKNDTELEKGKINKETRNNKILSYYKKISKFPYIFD